MASLDADRAKSPATCDSTDEDLHMRVLAWRAFNVDGFIPTSFGCKWSQWSYAGRKRIWVVRIANRSVKVDHSLDGTRVRQLSQPRTQAGSAQGSTHR
jgi:hypothetical protein